MHVVASSGAGAEGMFTPVATDAAHEMQYGFQGAPPPVPGGGERFRVAK